MCATCDIGDKKKNVTHAGQGLPAEASAKAVLFNGNISWMTTQLAKTGEINNDPARSMQSMLYRYDQLHRIVRSRSLTDYDPTTGFAARNPNGSAGERNKAYDEDYTYDANGNILTLRRNDELAALADDFVYTYYDSTNRLQSVDPAMDTMYVYDAIGNLVHDRKEGVTIRWTPYGKVRQVHKGDTLTVTYRYDATGNRIEKRVRALSFWRGRPRPQ